MGCGDGAGGVEPGGGLRHRAATRWHAASGGDLLEVSRLLGHASVATTQRYVRLPDGSARRIVLAAAG